MSDGQRTRRRFLADLLFVGGALGAGAFLMQADGDAVAQASPTPQATSTPDPSTQCPPQIDGEMIAPSPPSHNEEPPQVKGDVNPPPTIEGKVAAPQPPQPALPGKVAMPRPHAPVERKDRKIQGRASAPTHQLNDERRGTNP